VRRNGMLALVALVAACGRRGLDDVVPVDAACTCAPIASGSRLRAIHRVERGDDGSEIRYVEGTFFDSARSEDCSFYAAGTEARCLPTSTAGYFFLDDACTKAVASVSIDACYPSASPRVVQIPSVTSGPCTSAFPRVHPIGAEIAKPPVRYGVVVADDTLKCRSMADPGSVDEHVFALGPEIPQSSFVSGTVATETLEECACAGLRSGTRIKMRRPVVRGTDGSRSTQWAFDYDEVRKQSCFWSERLDGTQACLPYPRLFDAYFGDEKCEGPAYAIRPAPHACDTYAPGAIVQMPPKTACDDTKLHGLADEATLPATVYRRGFDGTKSACTITSPPRVDPGAKVFLVGAEIPRDAFASGTKTIDENEGFFDLASRGKRGSRLAPRMTTVRGTDGSTETFLYDRRDLARSEICTLESDRCLPVSSALSSALFFDAACSRPLLTFTPPVCGTASIPTYARVYFPGACPEPAKVFRLGAETSVPTPWYSQSRRPDGTLECNPNTGTFLTPGMKVYGLAEEVPLTSFVGVTYSREVE